jgi:hypothetical protein
MSGEAMDVHGHSGDRIASDPDRVGRLDDLKREFDLLRAERGRRSGKRALSLNDLMGLVRHELRREVPRSTLHNYVSGRTLAPPDVYEALLRAMGVGDAQLRGWNDAWDRLDDLDRRGSEPQPSAQFAMEAVSAFGPGRPGPLRRWKYIALVIATILTIGVAVTVTMMVSGSNPTTQDGNTATALAQPAPDASWQSTTTLAVASAAKWNKIGGSVHPDGTWIGERRNGPRHKTDASNGDVVLDLDNNVDGGVCVRFHNFRYGTLGEPVCWAANEQGPKTLATGVLPGTEFIVDVKKWDTGGQGSHNEWGGRIYY